jgi:hypothetical protein
MVGARLVVSEGGTVLLEGEGLCGTIDTVFVVGGRKVRVCGGRGRFVAREEGLLGAWSC